MKSFALATVMLVACFFVSVPASAATRYRVGISYSSSLMSKTDVFEFRLGNSIAKIAHGRPSAWFEGDFATGAGYTVTQISGPRTCTLSAERTGTITDHDVQILANCGMPPLARGKIQLTGIAQGETFTFADDYGRSLSTSFSATANLGGFPVGDEFGYRQTSGPRQCTLTSVPARVPSTDFIVNASCGAVSTDPTPTPAPTDFELVSRSADGKSTGTFYSSTAPVIGGTGADEGRYIAFVSDAAGLGGSLGKFRQIIWRDRVANVTKVISVGADGREGNGNSFAPSMSADGKSVAFESYATNLDPRDPNASRDVYVWRESSGRAELVSCTAGGVGDYQSYEPSISGDGNFVAFTSNATNLHPNAPGQSTNNVLMKDLGSGSIMLLSVDEKTKKGGGGSAPSVNFDGSRVAFYNYFPLTKEDSNGLWDIYVWERGNPKLRRVSKTLSGGERNQGEESASRVVWPSISGDGRFVTFSTTATNMGEGQTLAKQQVYVAEVDGGGVRRLSSNRDGQPGDADSLTSQGERVSITFDGRFVVFATKAANLGGSIVVKEVATGETQIVLKSGATVGRPDISRDGRVVVFGTSERLDKKYQSSGIFVKSN